MTLFANLAVLLVAFLHGYFLVLEMYFWDKPLGMRTFRLTPEFALASKTLAANQGLYNGFIAAGLLWGMYLGAAGKVLLTFLLVCVIIAGVYGAYSVGRRILWVQAVPAIIALGSVLLG